MFFRLLTIFVLFFQPTFIFKPLKRHIANGVLDFISHNSQFLAILILFLCFFFKLSRKFLIFISSQHDKHQHARENALKHRLYFQSLYFDSYLQNWVFFCFFFFSWIWRMLERLAKIETCSQTHQMKMNHLNPFLQVFFFCSLCLLLLLSFAFFSYAPFIFHFI